MRVLLIEDDPMIAKGLVRALSDAGMSVDHVADGELGLEAAKHGEHGVVLLDLGLPKLDGLKLLGALRKAGGKTPVLVITARDQTAQRIEGLDLGADDYIVKPFETAELLARVRAVARRHVGQAQSLIEAGAVKLDLATHRVSHHRKSEVLPAREFALMQALAERPGAILSKAQLEDRIYGWGEEVESNAVEVLIYYVRKKLGKDVIRNVRGAGWMIARRA